jgi:maleate isomerase
MYGHRARIGYCSPPVVTEVFVYEFYKMAPPGVSLLLTTSLEAAKYMAGAGADVVVLGGNPVNQSRGIENLPAICEELAEEIGTKVVASTLCQKEAMEKLGVTKVASAHASGAEHDERHGQQMENMGFESVGVMSLEGYKLLGYGKIPTEAAFDIAKQLKDSYPDADCIHLASAHWPTAHAIDRIESELGVSVMNSQQAIVWKAFRTAGISEPIDGFGRLFREF